ncbi:hypothetical protein Y032_0502g2623 [Ancylostoma ceylanicum]|uniref:Uncharacterized protein n=1 Tax=Ancylostoma ceylanicum TaxID=53326 RepID=A0A016WTJ7_9BILA|nr:hypothetical protein Y032_0502g2623 [Ancylostoma ceylanicum]
MENNYIIVSARRVMCEKFANFDFYLDLQVFWGSYCHVQTCYEPTVVFTTAGMNEISPDTIRGKRWVGFLHVEEKEPGKRRRTRMRGDAVGLGRRPEGVIRLCKGPTFAATVRRRPKVGENLETGPTVERRGAGI